MNGERPLPVYRHNKRRKLLQAFSFFAVVFFCPIGPLPARGAGHRGRRHAPDDYRTAALRTLPRMPDRPSHALHRHDREKSARPLRLWKL